MRGPRHLLLALLAISAVAQTNPPEPFSELMQKVSATPQFRERVLTVTKSVPKIGEWLSPGMVDDLRSAILGKNWQRVDHFPALTVAALNHSVDVAVKVAGKSTRQLTTKDILDLGTYSPDKSEQVNLDQPASTPTYAEDPETAVSHPIPGITMGDGPDPRLAPMHAESLRLAHILNRLALNTPHSPQLTVRFAGNSITDPGALIKILQSTNHQVIVDDDLYFANFGHLHDGTRDVMMPFWLDSQIEIPGAHRPLLVPVSHSEHELHIRGPKLNADVSYYFGIDGKSEFRTMDSLNQPWVMGRHAFTYTGDQAAEAINLLAQATRVFLAVHLAHPELPFGGYYTLGVCQDINAALEQYFHGRVILFPLTRDPNYFPSDPAQLHLDPRDGQFLRLLARTPDDRGHAHPSIDRVLGALPTNDVAKIVIPGLADDLSRVQRAHSAGLLKRSHTGLWFALPLLIACALLLLLAQWFARRRRQ